MTEQPHLSVVIPVRNGERWLGEQLSALAAQEYDGAWEVVIADNGSTDGTAELVAATATRFPAALRLVEAGQRVGAAHARNVGAMAARGQVVAFCDADDEVQPGWLDAAAAACVVAPAAAGVLLDENGNELNPGGLVGSAIRTGNMAIRRDVFGSIGGFDTSLPAFGYEDTEFSIRLVQSGYQPVGADQMRVRYRRTGNARGRVRKVYLSGQAFVCLWHRHPDQVPQPLRLDVLLIGLGLGPLRTLVEQRRIGAAARDLILRWGMVIGYQRWIRHGKLGEPVLIEALDL